MKSVYHIVSAGAVRPISGSITSAQPTETNAGSTAALG